MAGLLQMQSGGRTTPERPPILKNRFLEYAALAGKSGRILTQIRPIPENGKEGRI